MYSKRAILLRQKVLAALLVIGALMLMPATSTTVLARDYPLDGYAEHGDWASGYVEIPSAVTGRAITLGLDEKRQKFFLLMDFSPSLAASGHLELFVPYYQDWIRAIHEGEAVGVYQIDDGPVNSARFIVSTTQGGDFLDLMMIGSPDPAIYNGSMIKLKIGDAPACAASLKGFSQATKRAKGFIRWK